MSDVNIINQLSTCSSKESSYLVLRLLQARYNKKGGAPSSVESDDEGFWSLLASLHCSGRIRSFFAL